MPLDITPGEIENACSIIFNGSILKCKPYEYTRGDQSLIEPLVRGVSFIRNIIIVQYLSYYPHLPYSL